MMSALKSFVWGAISAVSLVVVTAGASFAGDSSVEFEAEAAAIAEVTAMLFDDIEASLAAPKADAAPRIRILGDAVQVSATTSAYPAFPADRGPVSHLTGYRVTWYPVDRFLGVVDFMGTYDGNRNLVCGFVTWDMTDPDAPKLEHLSATYVDIDLLATRDPSATEMALLNANCAYGEVAPNFAALVLSR